MDDNKVTEGPIFQPASPAPTFSAEVPGCRFPPCKATSPSQSYDSSKSSDLNRVYSNWASLSESLGYTETAADDMIELRVSNTALRSMVVCHRNKIIDVMVQNADQNMRLEEATEKVAKLEAKMNKKKEKKKADWFTRIA